MDVVSRLSCIATKVGKPRQMRLFRVVILVIAILHPRAAGATADGPDFFRVTELTGDEVLIVRSEPNPDSPKIGELPADTDGIQNLGCQGGLTFAEWQKASQAEREAARKTRWCRISYGTVKGWAAGWQLAEGDAPKGDATSATDNSSGAGPAFDCKKASGDIENLICSDQQLSALDRKLNQTFRAALAALKGGADASEATKLLKATQRGWIKGRNDCWKADDKRQCTLRLYDLRIADLQARYGLMDARGPFFYECNGNPADEIVATFFETEPATVRLERGDTVVIGVVAISGSGSRYVADHGITFWIKGDDAQVDWPEGNHFSCSVRK